MGGYQRDAVIMQLPGLSAGILQPEDIHLQMMQQRIRSRRLQGRIERGVFGRGLFLEQGKKLPSLGAQIAQ